MHTTLPSSSLKFPSNCAITHKLLTAEAQFRLKIKKGPYQGDKGEAGQLGATCTSKGSFLEYSIFSPHRKISSSIIYLLHSRYSAKCCKDTKINKTLSPFWRVNSEAGEEITTLRSMKQTSGNCLPPWTCSALVPSVTGTQQASSDHMLAGWVQRGTRGSHRADQHFCCRGKQQPGTGSIYLGLWKTAETYS